MKSAFLRVAAAFGLGCFRQDPGSWPGRKRTVSGIRSFLANPDLLRSVGEGRPPAAGSPACSTTTSEFMHRHSLSHRRQHSLSAHCQCIGADEWPPGCPVLESPLAVRPLLAQCGRSRALSALGMIRMWAFGPFGPMDHPRRTVNKTCQSRWTAGEDLLCWCLHCFEPDAAKAAFRCLQRKKFVISEFRPPGRHRGAKPCTVIAWVRIVSRHFTGRGESIRCTQWEDA
jgi:hypothetical protein